MKPNSAPSLFQLNVPATGFPASSRREKAASVLARSIGMEKVTDIGRSMRTLVLFSGCQRTTVGSEVLKPKVYGFSRMPPVVSSRPASTVTVYAVDAASPSAGVKR